MAYEEDENPFALAPGSPEGENDNEPNPFEVNPFALAEPDYGEAGGFTPLGAMAHQAVVHAPEMAGGGAAGILTGGLIGTAVGGPLGTVLGLGGGLLAGGGASYLLAKGKDWVLDQLGLREGTGFFSRAQEEAAQTEHPYASFAGDMLDTLLTGSPVQGASKATRLIGAGIMGGVEAGQQAYNEGKVDPIKVAGAAAMGAYAPGAQPWVTNLGERIGGLAGRVAGKKGTGTGAIQSPEAEAGQPGRPDLVTDEALKAADESGDIEAMTKEEADLQNDKTRTAQGVAEEQPAAVQNPETGNIPDEAGNATAGMVARVGSKPGEPGRNYLKTAKPAEPGIETTPTQTAVGEPGAADATIRSALTATETPEPPKLEETGLAPISSWQQHNRAEAAKMLQSPIGQRVVELARQGKVAAEIAQELNLDINDVRNIRDAAGISPVGEQGGMLTPSIPQEPPPAPPPAAPPKLEETGLAPKPEAPPPAPPVQQQQQQQQPQPAATVTVTHPKIGKLQVPPHVAAALNDPEIAKALATTQVDRSKHVPYIAGSSNDRGKVYIDRRVPNTAVTPDGNFRTDTPLTIHEVVEKGIMDRLIAGGMDPGAAYKVAHWGFAEPAEDAWYRANKVDPAAAEKWWGEQAQKIQTKGPKNIPKDLYGEPYPHDDPAHAHDGGVATQKPSPEELQKAIDILRGGKSEDADVAAARERLTKDAEENEGLRPVKEAIDRLPPEQQAEKLRRYAELVDRVEKAEVEPTPEEPAKPKAKAAERLSIWEGGPTARDKTDLAKKQKNLNVVTDTYAKFGKNNIPDKAPIAMRDWAKEVMDAAFKANDGTDPLVRPSYVPTQKGPHTEAYQWLRAVKKIAAAATPANIKALRALEAGTGGEKPPEGKSFAALDEETKSIEDSIKRRPTLSEAGAEIELSKQAQGVEQEREVIPEFTGEGESKVFVAQQKMLRDWLNGLSDEDYRTVANKNPDLRTDIDATQDPAELLMNYRDDVNPFEDFDIAPEQKQDLEKRLAKQYTRTPSEIANRITGKPMSTDEFLGETRRQIEETLGRGSPTAANRNIPGEGPPPKATVLRFEPTKPGEKASEGKSLKGTPEFEKLAAQYAKSKPKGSNEERLAHEESVAEEVARAAPPIQNDWDSFIEHAKKFMGDEEGGVNIGKMFNLPDWLRPSQHDLMSPDKNEATRDYGEQLTDEFHGMTNRLTQAKMNLRAAIRSADPLTPEKQRQIITAEQNKDIKSLPKELQKYYAEVIAPLKARYYEIMEELKALNEAHNLGLDIPELHRGIESAFVPRIGKDLASKADVDRSNIDALTGQTLSNWTAGLQPRDYLKLVPVDASGKPIAGDRLVFIPGDGQITIKRNGAPQIVRKNIPEDWKGNVGETINLKVKGKPGRYVVDHATIDEIRQANGKDTSGKFREDYHENSPYAWATRVNELEKILERERLLIGIKNDPKFQENTTVDRAEAAKRGYQLITTKLPQFAKRFGKDLFMPDSMRWALDDYYKRGYTESTIGQAFDRAATGLIKTMYFFGPVVHALNELDKWGISRGFDWVTPGGYKSLIKNGYTAIKSVTNQDAIQQVIRDFGGNPMLAHTLTRDIGPQVARHLGVDITNNPSKWDPVAKLWGISTRQLARNLYDYSSRPMWWASDVLLTQKFLENQSLHGMSPKDAIADAHQWIDSYRMPTTVGPKNEWGRAVSKALQTPAISLFGPYHYGLWHSFAHMTKNLINGATPRARNRAIGQLMMAGVIAYKVYPLLQQAAQWATGNESTEFSPRGLSLPMHKLAEIYEQKKGPEAALTDVFTPSIPLNMFMQGIKNQDWKGQPIMERGSSLAEKGGQLADWAARSMLPPYSQISTALEQPEATPGTVASHFAQGLVGAKTPSEKSIRYQNQLEHINAQREKARRAKPQGVLEDLVNYFTTP